MDFNSLISLAGQYPLDLTASSPNNYVGGVEYTLPATGPKVFYLNEGFFYTESLIVFDPDQSKALERGVDYYVMQMNGQIEVQSAHRAACFIYIKDPLVGARVEVSAQIVGGYYILCMESIKALYDRVVWPSVTFKNEMQIGVVSLFEVDHPLFDSQDRYGFGYMVAALDRVRNAVSFGDAIAWNDFYEMIEALRTDIEVKSNQLKADVLAHIADKNNPHGTTAADAGAVTATDIQALVQSITMQMASAVSALTTNLGGVATILNNHIANTNNPHQINASKLGAATQTYINTLAGYLTDRYNALVNYINSNFYPKNTFWWSYNYWLRSWRPSDDVEAYLVANPSVYTTWLRLGRTSGGGNGNNATQIEFTHADNGLNIFVDGTHALNIYAGDRILLRAEILQMIENAKCRCTFVCNRCDCNNDCGDDTYCVGDPNDCTGGPDCTGYCTDGQCNDCDTGDDCSDDCSDCDCGT